MEIIQFLQNLVYYDLSILDILLHQENWWWQREVIEIYFLLKLRNLFFLLVEAAL